MRDVKFGFTTGEIDPELYGRSDLEKYSLGAAGLENFVVSFSGAVKTRPPLRFVEFAPDPDEPVRFFAFEFSNSLDNTYLVVFGAGWIRFVQDGAYVLEAGKTVTSVTSGAVNCTAHGYALGDLVYLDSHPGLLVVAGVTTNTFTVENIDGQIVIPASGATVARRVLTLSHPYLGQDLRNLKADQVFDVVKFTHPDYAVRLLTRTATTWTFTEETRLGGKALAGTLTAASTGKYIRSVRVTNGGSGYTAATVLTLTDDTGANAVLSPTVEAGVIISVTIIEGGRNYTAPSLTASVGTGATFEITLSQTEAELVFSAAAVVDGKETGIFRPLAVASLPDITQAKGSYTFTIPTVPGAEFYNYYRSIIYPFANQANIGVDLGWIGASRATKFVDNNITPDFTKSPRGFSDPFISGQITAVRVTAAGTNYTRASTITVTHSTGTGAVLYPIVDDGKLVGVYIADGGKNYTATGISFSISGGTSGAIAAEFSEPSGNFPAVSFTFQQRAGYAATRNNPMTVWCSRLEEGDNFAAAQILDATDPYSYTLDANRVSRIRHALPVQQGLLLFTNTGVMMLRAGEGAAVTALNGVLDIQSYFGCSEVPPAVAAEDILYVQEKSRGLRMLSFNSVSRRFDAQEISVFSRHLFAESEVRALAMTMDSENRAYGVFENGKGFTATIFKEQGLFAFAPMTTKGLLEDVVSVNVGKEEHVYFSVKRGNRRVIEYIRPFETSAPEDHCTLDSRISTEKNFPAAALTASGVMGEITLTSSVPVFGTADVGKVVFIGGGRGVITERISGNEIRANFTRPIVDLENQSNVPAPAAAGKWWMNPLVTSITGIPYEGETLAVVVDGKRQTDKTVVNGTITLDDPGAIVHVGFLQTARLKTLPPPDMEGKTVNMIGAAVLYKRVGTMSLGVGNSAPYPQPLRASEPWFEPLAVAGGERFSYLNGSWISGGNVSLEISDGLTAEILRVTVFFDVGADVYDPPAR